MSLHWGGRGHGHRSRRTQAAAGGTPTPTPPGVRNAPVLSLTSNTTYPPPLVVDLDSSIYENDVLRVQSSASVDFASILINDTSVLNAAAIASGSVSVTGLSAISSPTQTYFRARVEPPGLTDSDWAVIVKHGDTTAPTITSSASPSAAENTVGVTGTLTANEDIAAWTINGGTDAAKFSLVGATWTLTETPDYETQPSYVVEWRATDYGGNFTLQTMTLTITDVAESSPSTFSTTQKSSLIALSNGDLTATTTLVAQNEMSAARISQSKTGKRFCQFTINALPANYMLVGVGPSTYTWTAASNGAYGWPGRLTGDPGFSIGSDGVAGINGGATSGVTPVWGAGDIISIAFDEPNGKCWFGHTASGGSTITWYGDPAAGTGGFSSAAGMDAYFAFAAMQVYSTSQRQCTFNGGATAFVGTVPSGFTGYDL